MTFNTNTITAATALLKFIKVKSNNDLEAGEALIRCAEQGIQEKSLPTATKLWEEVQALHGNDEDPVLKDNSATARSLWSCAIFCAAAYQAKSELKKLGFEALPPKGTKTPFTLKKSLQKKAKSLGVTLKFDREHFTLVWSTAEPDNKDKDKDNDKAPETDNGTALRENADGTVSIIGPDGVCTDLVDTSNPVLLVKALTDCLESTDTKVAPTLMSGLMEALGAYNARLYPKPTAAKPKPKAKPAPKAKRAPAETEQADDLLA